MNPRARKNPRTRGFALVITLSLMVLLTILSIGLLSLSSISLRSSSSGEASAQAYANARLAAMLAIGELQKHAGDDRRITADASISTKATQTHQVGVWSSWSPNFAAAPTRSAPNYATEKTNSFRSWLASSPDSAALKDPKWSESGVESDWVRLFTTQHDGFDLSAPPVPTPQGTLAWTLTQENTKAKVNVAGPEEKPVLANVSLQAQQRPSLALASSLKEPGSGWNLRAGRVLSFNQVELDSDLTADAGKLPSAGASFTVHAQGLLTDVVRGGLKTDMNLGFELSDSVFARASWDDTPNPFRSAGANAGFTAPSSYRGQQPLFRPLVENPIISKTTDFWPANVAHRFYAAGVPTFDHLRSFYRIPYHLYGGSGTPTVAERGGDHVAIKIPAATGGTFFPPASPPGGALSTLPIRPVLNRLMYLLSTTLSADNQVRLVLTPVISLWNPYNTALEIEGAVAYPWIDVPFSLNWEIKDSAGAVKSYGVAMSRMMGKQFEADKHGRSVNPYFLCQMTAGGSGTANTPIRFEAGEVRVFVPSSKVPVDFLRTGSNAARTVKMRPVDNVSMFSTKGGLTVQMKGGVDGEGFDHVVKSGDSVRIRVAESSTSGEYHYFVSLEDAARIKNTGDSTRGLAVSEVQMLGFRSLENNLTSPYASFNELKNTTNPFGVLETFHRVAKQSLGGQPIADLVYTTNPRHTAINHQLSNGSFTVAPNYQSTLRSASSFNGAIETTSDGRRSFWGPSQKSLTGKDRLSFFEIPRQPLLSLAAFQNADLASSTFSSAHQFANSWASPYLARTRAGMTTTQHVSTGVPIYDTPYLANEALWDSFFFSGAAPRLQPASNSNPASAWKGPIASVEHSLDKVLEEFVADPLGKPLANPRMRLVKGGYPDDKLVERLLDPAGCTRIAAHLMVDGAFNINSTDVEAWVSLLAGMRGQPFEVEGGSPSPTAATAFPRFRHPTGEAANNWNGFRVLSDAQIRTLAARIVEQVQLRGPFLSLGEFVNRRMEGSDLGRSGAIQAAIDKAKFNDSAKQASFSTDKYPADARQHIITDTGVGIPGYLTQADVLQSLAPVITPRSDTFTVRGYGEAKDSQGKVTARAWCEAVVQRVPEFIDPVTPADSRIASATPLNQTFGRRFEIVSFRRIPRGEIQ